MSLARALAVGCLSRLDPRLRSIDVWDPAAGSGFAGLLLVEALRSAGIQVRYRGQDISAAAVATSRHVFGGVPDVEVVVGNTLERDEFEDFAADLVIVDAPWGQTWASSAEAVEFRRREGAFRFGLPQRSDSTWLFISLALEKLRPAAEGGGRVAALVHSGALSASGDSAGVRRRLLETGLLESVTRLPEGLAPNTSIPLYLLTFTNRAVDAMQGKALIADLRTQFTTEDGYRTIPSSALMELESGLRTGRQGPRNRLVDLRQFIRRDAPLSRRSSEGHRLTWRLTTFNNMAIDTQFVNSRYGPSSDVSIDGEPRETFDLDPSRIFRGNSRDLEEDMRAKGWPSRRLSCLLATEPEAIKETDGARVGDLFIPTTRQGRVTVEIPDGELGGRVLSIRLDGDLAQPGFLAAWLNSEQGIVSRRRAIDASSSGSYIIALRSDASTLMRWADELIVPVPGKAVQLELASVDERLASFQAALDSQREGVWVSPEKAEEVVSKIASAFDDSLTLWFEQLPFPVASALWTAETATSLGDKLQSYLHAWEALVTFHATVLLSAIRSDPGKSAEIEASIRNALHDQRIGIDRASFGTWVVILETISKNLRRTLESGDADEVARIRAAFGDLTEPAIERLISKDLVKKFKELNVKRNRWRGHGGHTSEEERRAQVDSLISDLRELRQTLGSVWTQLLLVCAGSAKRGHDGYIQAAEVAVGTRSPFVTREFRVGDAMLDGELYLVRNESQSPLRLLQFVQLRAAPQNGQYTSYFYNRIEGARVRLVSYQYGAGAEMEDDAERFRDEFGALLLG
ncbi:HsdM family class I SAM-dependent methyltransferase [Nocardia acidivorans]|uniref:HsdM family class I SAM-dependent methyltransferase n=1 Tax=Nocardia acidivorans TaxID=404580 RepID=UPI0014710409|nr:N-6 DNA methylase [Nocardia acidivorans]